MSALREWMKRFLETLHPSRADRELEQELRSHLEFAVEDARRGDDHPDRRIRSARIQAGGIAQTMEALRDQRGLPWLADVLADVRFGWRLLTRDPGFATVAILTLAIGIGATTAVFTVADTLLLRPPPFEHAERIYWIYDVNEELRQTVNDAVGPSPGNFIDWRERTRSFDYMVAWRNWWFSVAGPSNDQVAAEQVRGVSVSPSFFDMLGVRTALGRSFRPEEEEPGRDQVAVLTDGFWRRRFGGDPAIVGRAVTIDGRPFLIVGVLPAEFYFLWPDSAVFMPMRVDASFRSLRSSHSVAVLARLRPGVARTDAQAELDQLSQDLAAMYPTANQGWSAALQPVFPLNRNLRPALLEPVVYLSYLQNPSRYMHLLVRTASGPPTNVTHLVQRTIQAVDPDVGAYDPRSMEAVLDQAVAAPRLNSLLLWVFATVALLLSAAGVYGVTSYVVTQRTQEFAIRIAIGAETRSVFHMVTRQGLAVAAVGIAMGLGGALLLARLFAGVLYGVVPTDPVTLVASAGVMLAVVLVACWRPAWRATRVDPITVLRAD